VTSPGDQSGPADVAITTLPIAATDSSSTATLAYSDGGTLPPGLSIDSASGHITGTPTTSGSYPVTITATDGSGAHGSTTFTWTIANTVTVTNPGHQSSVTGTAISPLSIAATDSSSSATLSYTDGGTLPPGLSIDSSSGVVSGTPTTAGSSTVTITATDGSGANGSTTFTWTTTNMVTVTNPGNQSGVSNTAITPLPITASDSSPAATLSYTDHGSLPTGLSINPSSGVITGTPTTAGTFPVSITATDGAGYSGLATFSWVVTNTVSVTNPGDQTSDTGKAISPLTVTAVDSSSRATLSYSAGGTLPPGLSIGSGTGAITGTPTTTGTYPVTVTATDNAGFSGSATFHWTIVNLQPVVSAVKPSSGPGAGGTKVTVTGSSLKGATSVQFGTTDATQVTVNGKGTKLTAVSPAGAAGTVDITVNTPGGPSAHTSADRFTYAGPSVTSVNPASGSTAGGTSVKIGGTDLDGATSVSFGSTPATSFTAAANGKTIIAISPAHAAGTVDLVITTPGGSSTPASADQFTYVGTSITGITPSGGSGAGGTQVTISGTELSGTTSVTFGGVAAASFAVKGGGTSLKAVSPAHAAGTVNIVVTTPGGTVSGPFTYTGPTITTVTPSTGPAAGGTHVNISGTDLDGATSVTFGSAPATSFTANGPGTKITAVAPAHAAGSVTITVTTPGGTSTATFNYS
jgi:hypothetical protein